MHDWFGNTPLEDAKECKNTQIAFEIERDIIRRKNKGEISPEKKRQNPKRKLSVRQDDSRKNSNEVLSVVESKETLTISDNQNEKVKSRTISSNQNDQIKILDNISPK